MLNKYKEDFILLTEAGFIAVNQADEDAAKKLFHAALLLDATNTLPSIGLGYLAFHKLELTEAIKIFEEVLRKEPNNEMARTLLGITKSMTVNQVTEAEKLLHETSQSSEENIKKLSGMALEFVDKFIKKEPSPVEVKKPKQ